MIFEAKPSEILRPEGNFGAFIDLPANLTEGSLYEISSKVKSADNSTMGFQLWVHDAKTGISEVKQPMFHKTPAPGYFETIKVEFVVTETKAMRIHLHCKPGNGKIIVSEVAVLEKK